MKRKGTITAEEAGLSSALIANELRRLDEADIQLHSFLLMKSGKLVVEAYWKPFERKTLHRMYSVTKSFVSVAIGSLVEQGKLNLTDRITGFFPEYAISPVDPFLEECTLLDLLKMASCHSRTAYKNGTGDNCVAHFSDNWVKSFFSVPPDHAPGALFCYDTSATQVLTALCEKISGKSLFELLSKEFSFASGSHIIKEPGGVCAGGSGLVTRPIDLIVAADGIRKRASIEGSYLYNATNVQIDTWCSQGLEELTYGYGYHFWCLEGGAYAMYGLGGQLAIIFPSKELVFVTTADTQGKSGGDKALFSSISRIAQSASELSFKADEEGEEALEAVLSSLSLKALSSDISGTIPSKSFSFPGGRKAKLTVEGDRGTFSYTEGGKHYNIPFGIGHNLITPIPMKASSPGASSAAFTSEHSLTILVQFLGEELGSLKVEASYIGNRLTLAMKLNGEVSFTGFSGVMSSL